MIYFIILHLEEPQVNEISESSQGDFTAEQQLEELDERNGKNLFKIVF